VAVVGFGVFVLAALGLQQQNYVKFIKFGPKYQLWSSISLFLFIEFVLFVSFQACLYFLNFIIEFELFCCLFIRQLSCLNFVQF